MFKLNMQAIRQSANDSWLMANAANLANLANESGQGRGKISQKPPELAGLAKLAISQQRKCTLQTEPVPDPASAEPPGLESPTPEPSADPEAWRELAQAYYRHHFKCVVCIAAGRGANYGPRCGAGAALWQRLR